MNRKQRRALRGRDTPVKGLEKDPAALEMYCEAVALLKAGNLQRSRDLHEAVLALKPRHAQCLHHLGLIAFYQGRKSEAAGLLRQCVEHNSGYSDGWLSLAIVLADQGRLTEARAACERCLELNPGSSGAWAALARLLQRTGDHAAAVGVFERSIALDARQSALLLQYGDSLLALSKPAEALQACHRAMAAGATGADAKRLELKILAATGRLDAALQRETGDPDAEAVNYAELGLFLHKEGRNGEAITAFKEAIRLAPDHARTHFCLGAAFDAMGSYDQALAAYRSGLQLEPDNAMGYVRTGALLRRMRSHDGALTAFEHAVRISPELAIGQYNLAVSYMMLGRLEDALAAFNRAFESEPTFLINRLERANLRRVLVDWQGLEADEQACLALLNADKDSVVAPFNFFFNGSGKHLQLEAARRFSRGSASAAGLKFDTHRTRSDSGRPIRIGYLSADFFHHATALLLAETLELHDRKRFEVFGYCYSDQDGSALRQRIMAACDSFVIVREMTHANAARCIHADGVDILVDLKGHTRDARSEIIASRPAPIQVNYLGYPGTMGAEFIDYIIADPIVAPHEHQPWYDEKIVHLPNCYQPFDRRREIEPGIVTRAEHGLPEDGFVFCSFNNRQKLNPRMFAIWMRLLAQVPGSVLWLLEPNHTIRERLRDEASRAGISPDRIVFCGRMPIEKHLKRHAAADLFLDSLPCTAHTTASDALVAGLPMVTCLGDTFAGRVGASVLSASGMPELVTRDLEEYEALALALARDDRRLRSIREKLVAMRSTAPLFDSVAHTRALEQAYEVMVARRRSGSGPAPFSVT
ncbi:MAG TPA: tetratricopeptide repeat protein [Hyphomicrobiaceae bacterium]|nr:tetratricopeptide repeat protein [Hyphomicrobiaceae bacterium]